MLRAQLFEADGRIVGKAVALQLLSGFLTPSLTPFVSSSSLGSQAREAAPPPGSAFGLHWGL